MKKFWLFFGIVLALLFVGNVGLAQTEEPSGVVAAGTPTVVQNEAAVPSTEVAPAAKAEAQDEVSEEPVGSQEVLTDVEKVINSWKTIGWLAGLIALIQLLMKLLRFGPIDNWFEANKKRWMKPYIASTLGAILGGLSTYATNANVLNSIITGLIIGTTSVGWNELINKFQSEKRVV